MLSFDNLIQTVSGITDWISNTVESITGIFSDIDFSILYSWCPNDIAAVLTAIISVLLVLALIGLLKKMILFFG